MTPTTVYFLSVFACSGILFLYYTLALRNNNHHRWNRFYLLSAIAFSLILPLLSFTVKSEPVPDTNWAMLLEIGLMQQPFDAVVKTENVGAVHQFLLPCLYSLIGFLLAFKFVVSLRRIISLTQNLEAQERDGVTIIFTTEPGAPFTFFHYIFWNPAVNMLSDEGKQILQHEMVHVKDRH